jgi:hypothetical protein
MGRATEFLLSKESQGSDLLAAKQTAHAVVTISDTGSTGDNYSWAILQKTGVTVSRLL